MKTKHEIVGNCPKCGAPLYAQSNPAAADLIPLTVYTCQCRFAAQAQLPSVWPVNPNIIPWQPLPTFPTYPWYEITLTQSGNGITYTESPLVRTGTIQVVKG